MGRGRASMEQARGVAWLPWLQQGGGGWPLQQA